MAMITREHEKVKTEKKKRKKSEATLEFEERCDSFWKKLSENYVCTLSIPNNYLTLPEKDQALRSLQSDIVENSLGPRMWKENVNFFDKSGICAVCEVLHCLFYIYRICR